MLPVLLCSWNVRFEGIIVLWDLAGGVSGYYWVITWFRIIAYYLRHNAFWNVIINHVYGVKNAIHDTFITLKVFARKSFDFELVNEPISNGH